jgi:histidinol-phosphate phosphatase family protein
VKNLDVVILAGGAGTRSANPKLPKILQEVDKDHKLLGLHLENLKRLMPQRVIFVLGHFGEIVRNEILSMRLNERGFEIIIIQEEDFLGTSSALSLGLEQAVNEDVLVVLGDTAIGVDYNKGYIRWKSSNCDSGLYVHPNTHPQDSDSLLINGVGDVIAVIRKGSKSPVGYPLKSVTGSIFLKKSIFLNNKILKASSDYIDSIFLGFAQDLTICALITSSYFADSGTPSRLTKIIEDYKSGSFQRRAGSEKSAIFLDRDGCLVPDIPKGRMNLHATELETDTLSAIANANKRGIPVFIVTNQPAIAKGWISEADVFRVQGEFEAILQGHQGIIDDFRFCPHHPERGFAGEIQHLKIVCNCRKPKPGMILHLADLHGVKLSNSFVVGDSSSDLDLALAVGARGIRARHGTGEVASAIDQCIELICVNN